MRGDFCKGRGQRDSRRVSCPLANTRICFVFVVIFIQIVNFKDIRHLLAAETQLCGCVESEPLLLITNRLHHFRQKARHILVCHRPLYFLPLVVTPDSMSAPAAAQTTDPIPHSVAETLSVTTDGSSTHEVTVTQSTLPVPASNIPSVGASISVPDSGSGASLVADRSSSALLSLASSCSLTEILNAQQQALEQFQCQLQLAQQTEAINQRLDAIERTLNSLIQQRAQDEAVKNAAAVAAAAAVVNSSQVNTPLRPSQQLQLPPMTDDSPGSEGKKKKLPRELCVS